MPASADFVYDPERVRQIGQAFDLSDVDYASMLAQLDEQFRKNEAALFTSEGATGGERWADLSTDYAAFKAGRRKKVAWANRQLKRVKFRPVSQLVLQWSGNLKRSLGGNRGHSEHVADVVETLPAHRAFVLGTRNVLAHYHYEGRHGKNPMPARNPIAHTDVQKREYLGLMKAYVHVKFEAVFRSLRRAGTARGVRR